MSTIVAVERGVGTVFAWDSLVSWGDRVSDISGLDSKVFRNGPAVFGVAGVKRVADVLRFLPLPGLEEAGFDPTRWVVSCLVPLLVGELDGGKFFEGVSDSESHVIVAVGGVVGYLTNDFAWVPDLGGVFGVGSGSGFAIGALCAGASVEEAVGIAADWDLNTGGVVCVATVEELMA